MRILFDQGVYDLRNKGNVALTQVAVSRLHAMWPDAELEVMTSAPQILRLYCPGARPVLPDGRHDARRFPLSHMLLQAMPVPVVRTLLEARESYWRQRNGRSRDENLTPGGLSGNSGELAGWHASDEGDGNSKSDRESGLASLLEGVDLFVVTGAQFMSDPCRDAALGVFDRLEAANRRGIPTAMVGQGVGPFDEPDLRRRARSVYPLVDLILVRDGRTAPPLLSALGVDNARVVFTGDDAIELVYTARTSHPGQAIGVSLRRSHYTLVGTEDMDVIRAVLQQAAAKHNTKLKPVPISYSSHEMDENVIQGLLNGGRTIFARRRRFQTPVQIVKSVGGCRLVVTGAFHAAVFALAQGIPAVGLARTPMYLDKFQSLADQFGTACQPVHLGGEDLATRLERAIDFAWNAADDLRPGLLEAAQRHIALGRAGYRRLHELVEPRPHRPVAGIS